MIAWLARRRARLRLGAACFAAICVLALAHSLATLYLLRADALRAIDRTLIAALSGAAIDAAAPARPAIDAWVLEANGSLLREEGAAVDAAPAAALPAPDMGGVPAGVAYDIAMADGTVRAVQAVRRSGATTLVVRASLPLAPVEALTSSFLSSAALGLPVLLAVAGAAALLVAGAALAPVLEITRRLHAHGPGAAPAPLPRSGSSSEIARLSAAINELLAREQMVHRKQARFATEAAHELRTPLTAQRSMGELALRADTAPAALREALSSMLEQCQHMQNLVDSLLLVARAEGGMLGVPRSSVDACELADAALRSMVPLAEQKDQPLSVQIQGPLLVVADATLLRQALLNLIHNAVVHTPTGTRIDVGVRTNAQGEVVISVSDDGPGFAAYEPGQVVRRYSRRAEDRSGRGGLGLGLTIAQSLVHAQGGRMVVDSQVGVGTAIRLHFPASAGSQPAGSSVRYGRRRSDEPDGASAQAKRPTFLLTAVLKGNRRVG